MSEDRWVNAVFTMRLPLDGVSPDAEIREQVEAASRRFDDVFGDDLPPDTTIEVTAEVVVEGEVEERVAA